MNQQRQNIVAAYKNIVFKLVYDQSLNGYKFVTEYDKQCAWESKNGPVGIRVIDENNKVTDFKYFAYSSVTFEEGSYVGRVEVESDNRSMFEVTDRFSSAAGKVYIVRDILVLSADQRDKGYMISFPLCSHKEVEPTSLRWYAPGVWYGIEQGNFTDRSKFCFKGKESAFSVDSVSAAYISNFDEHTKLGLSLMDMTPGRRETVKGDSKATEEKFLVDDRINLPGLGLRKLTVIDQEDNAEDGFTNGGGARRNYTEVFHTFPGYTRNFRGWYTYDTVIWRFIPVCMGSSRQTKLCISFDEFANSFECFRNVWREAYDRNKNLIDRRYDIKSHFLTVADYVDRSFSIENGHPQYMTNTGHWWPSSGFLVRNVDLASILINVGHKYNNQRYIQHARAVINDQVDSDYGNPSMYAVGFIRALCESLQYTLKAYLVEKKYGFENKAWYEKVISKADGILDQMDEQGNLPPTVTSCDYGKNTGFHIVPFLVELFNHTKDNKYLTAAKKAADFSWEKGFKDLRFRDGILDYGEGLPENDMESGVIALECYTSLYKATNEVLWLERAKIAADYVETWQNVHDLNLVPYDVKGWSSAEACYGNETLPSYGLSYINVGSNGADVFGAVAALDFYIIYEATGEEHYLHFAQNLLFNSTLYTNMDDKSGVMSDVEYHAGAGFQNEFIIIGPDTYEAYGNISSARGNGHNHNIGWTPFVVLNMVNRIMDYTGEMNFYNTIRSVDIEAANPSIEYRGSGWIQESDKNSFNNSIMKTSVEKDNLEFSFGGTNIELYGRKSDSSGLAEVYLDGALKAKVDFYCESEESQMLLWKSGNISYGKHLLKVIAKGEKNPASKHSFVGIDRLLVSINNADGIKRINCDDSLILYKGKWKGGNCDSCYEGNFCTTSLKGDYFELTFPGTEIAWYANLKEAEGEAEVYIDDTLFGVVSAKECTNNRIPLWRSPMLENANHKLRVVAKDTKGISVDRLEYVQGESITVLQDDFSVKYSGTGWNTQEDKTCFSSRFTSSQTKGDSLEFEFSGREISLYAKKSEDQGIAIILIDGIERAVVDLYCKDTRHNEFVWNSGELLPGEHTIGIVVKGDKSPDSTGTAVNIDTLVYAKSKEIALLNPGFEMGDTSGWMISRENCAVKKGLIGKRENWSHSGSCHMEISDVEGKEGRVWMKVENLKGGRRYKAIAWLRGERECRFFARPGDGAEMTAIVDGSPNGWMLKEIVFTLPDKCTSVEIGLIAPNTDCDVKWACIDDIRLLEA